MKAYLVESDEIKGMLIDADEVVEKIFFMGPVYMFVDLDVTAENEAMLNALLPRIEDCEDNYEVEELFDQEELIWEESGVSVEPDNILCYSPDDMGIINLAKCEAAEVYEYVDNGNFMEIFRYNDAQNMCWTTVEYDEDDCEDLDESPRQWHHSEKYPIVSIDGEEVENRYLLREWVNGGQYYGYIVDEDDNKIKF